MYCLLNSCCVCLTDRENLQRLSNTDIDNIQFLDKLNFCAFENEWIQTGFPLSICYKCCHNLRIAYEFKKMCHKNSKLLRGYVNQMNINETNDRFTFNLEQKLVQDTVVAQYCKTELDFNPNEEDNKDTKQLTVPFELFNQTHQCSFCNRSFTQKSHLDKHLVSHANKKSHNCTLCNKTFSRKLHLERHLLIHNGIRSHHCTSCGKSFILKSHLNDHMLTHTGIKSHRCSLCSKTFARKSDLHRHTLIHSVEKSYNCTYCHKSFANKSHLARHMIFHSGKRPHHCTLCNKSYILKTHLKDHMLTHTGIKSHHCSLCSKSFGRKSDLNRHMLTHNSDRRINFT